MERVTGPSPVPSTIFFVMISSSVRNKIVNSYSLVLEDILNSSDNKLEQINKIYDLTKNISDFDNFVVSPIELKQYKKVVDNIKKEIEKGNEIELFFERILERRYLFLLNSIIENTKKRIERKQSINVLNVFSLEQLDENLKKEIKNIISSKVKDNFEVVFNTRKDIKKDTIDFVVNEKICSIDLNKLVSKYFEV